jgi:hypothetical protein
MLIFKNNINPLYFIHIPRTAGRYLRELFRNNNEYTVTDIEYSELFHGKQIPHLQYPLYNEFTNYGKINQFTIVRNPIDRFISMFCAVILKEKYIFNQNKVLNNKNLLFNFIEDTMSNLSFSSNWFLPQHHFINHSCKIWKLEDGFNDKFYKWMKSNFKVEFKIKNINKNQHRVEYDFYKKIKLNKKTKEFIKEFYKYDYKLLDYK